jgi:RNA recognition motif-containing protein
MSRVYVGNLPNSASKNELEREFERFGRLRDVWVARNPPGFAFIEFEDARDAEVMFFFVFAPTFCFDSLSIPRPHPLLPGCRPRAE